MNRIWHMWVHKSKSPVCFSSQEPDAVLFITLYPQMDTTFSIQLSYLACATLLRTGSPVTGWGAQESHRKEQLLQLLTNSSVEMGTATPTNKVKRGEVSPAVSTWAKPKCHFGTTRRAQPKHSVVGLSLLPSHIFFPLGYNSHLHSTYYNILQQ